MAALPKAARKVLDVLSSMGLTCVLLVFLFLLTLFGTFEQIEHGLFQTQKKYFESWFLVHRLGPLSLPLPGGVLCMSVLAVNLLLGGLVRIRKSWRTAGIIVVHLGIALMLAAALVKMTGSDDGHLTLFEGQQSDEFESYYLWEVAIWDAAQEEDVRELLIPHEHLTDLTGDRARTFRSDELPFDLRLSHFQPNCDVLPKGPMWNAAGPVVEGFGIRPDLPDPTAERNIAGMVATVLPDDGGEERTGLLWGVENYPWTVEADGRTWAISLRHKRYSMPFTVRLEDFVKEDHPGMAMAKSFHSDIVKRTDGGEQRMRIEMNEPLRDSGLVLFQASWGPEGARPGDPLFSTLAVVRNPSDHWPTWSCVVIGVGLLLTFGHKLLRYVRAQEKSRALTEEVPS